MCIYISKICTSTFVHNGLKSKNYIFIIAFMQFI